MIYPSQCSCIKRFTPIILLAMLLLGGCGAPIHKVVTPDVRTQMLQDLREGKLVLVSNNLNASLYFITSWRNMAAAYEAHQWEKLAILVMTTGHEIDIAYYFLGASAEQLGYYDAAMRYYSRAVDLYNDNVYDHHCRELIGFGGCPINLRRALPARIANVQHLLQAQQMEAEAQAREEAARRTKRPHRRRSVSHRTVKAQVKPGKTESAAKPEAASAGLATRPAEPMESIANVPVRTSLPQRTTATPEPTTPTKANAPVQGKVHINMPDLKSGTGTPSGTAPAKKAPAKPADEYS